MKESKISWLNVAYGLAVTILVGMSLPWVTAFDLSGNVFDIGIATFRGWNLVWLVIPVLVAIVTYVVAFRTEEQNKWLWVALIFSVISLLIMVTLAVRMILSREGLIISEIPLIGFWITLFGFVAVIVILIRSLLGARSL